MSKTRVKPKRLRRRLRALSNAQQPQTVRVLASNGAWQNETGVAAKVLAAFGPAAPPAGMVRVLKDVLPVGRWRIGEKADGSADWWNVTRDTLLALARNHKLAASHGVSVNLGKGHGDLSMVPPLIHPDDLIAPIADANVVDDTLWISAFVTPEQRDYLLNPARKVSIGVLGTFTDGAGHEYSPMMIHTAVTDHPVIPFQKPFLALANAEPTSTDSGSPSMDIVQAVNMLLEALGLGQLPDDTTPENVVDRLVGLAAGMGGEASEEPTEEVAPDAGGELPPPEPVPGMEAMAMSAATKTVPGNVRSVLLRNNPELKVLSEQIKTLTSAVEALQSDKAQQQKAAYEGRLNELGKAGVPANVVNHYKTLGPKVNYDTAILLGLATPQAQPLAGRTAKTLATSAAPNPTTNAPVNGDAVVAERLKARGIDPDKYMPKFGN